MPELARFANRFRFLTLLRALLGLGAALAAVVALLLVATPATLAGLLDLPARPAATPLRLLALALLLLAGLYYEALRDPRRYSGIVRAAIAGHLLTAAVFALAAQWAGAAVNALLGLALAGTWWPLRA